MIINTKKGGGGLQPGEATYSQMNEPCSRYMAEITYTGKNSATITLDWDVPPTSWTIGTTGAPITVVGNGNTATVTCTGTTLGSGWVVASNGTTTYRLLCSYNYIENETWISFMTNSYYTIGDGSTQRPLGYATDASGDIVTIDRYAHRQNTNSNSSIYNITPSANGGNYIAQTNGTITAVGNLTPTGQVRMVDMTPVNVRDIGGWSCDGGSLKYGMLFRGGEVYNVLTSDDIAMAKNLLGIQAEIDLDATGSQSVSSFGSDVNYYYCGVISYYRDGIDLSNQSPDAPWRQYVKAIKAAFECVKRKNPVYFHCQIGADRTGTLAFILEQLAGVSVYDSEKDYELTSFSQGTGGAGVRQRHQGYGSNLFAPMENYFKTCSTSSLMRDCVVAWCVLAGISIDDINEYRANVSTGTPETVTAQIDYSIKTMHISPSSWTLEVGESKTLTAGITPSWATGTLTWTSSNSSVASVVADETTATVTGVGNGTATITVTDGNVTATSTITVTGVTPSYTNVFVPADALLNTRLGSSGTTSAQNGSCTTDYIDITGLVRATDYIYVKGFDKFYVSGAAGYFFGYTSDKTKTSFAGGAQVEQAYESLGTNYGRISLKDLSSGIFTNAQYIRFNFYPNGSTTAISSADIASVIVTLNEPIE